MLCCLVGAAVPDAGVESRAFSGLPDHQSMALWCVGHANLPIVDTAKKVMGSKARKKSKNVGSAMSKVDHLETI